MRLIFSCNIFHIVKYKVEIKTVLVLPSFDHFASKTTNENTNPTYKPWWTSTPLLSSA